MGYSKSLAAVKKVELYLAAMSNKVDRHTWAAPDSKKLTYAIHQGMFSAKFNKVVPFDNLYDTYKVRNSGHLVIAEPTIWKPAVVVEVDSVALIDEKAVSLLDAVNVLINTKFSIIDFIALQLSDIDYIKLGKWANKNGFDMVGTADKLTFVRSTDNGSSINEKETS